MLIAARNGMLVGGGKITAKSYIQDGLVAMWDGIENVGWGMHDATSNEWVNLVGGTIGNLSWENGVTGVSWNDDCLYLANGNGNAVFISRVNAPQYTATTVEIVLKVKYVMFISFGQLQQPLRTETSTYPCARTSASSLHQPGFAVATLRNGRNYAYSIDDFQAQEKWASLSTIGPQIDDYATLFINNNAHSLLLDTNASANVPGYISLLRCQQADAYIRSFRYYSRALTADEIAHNYAVDKARFNLPDAT